MFVFFPLRRALKIFIWRPGNYFAFFPAKKMFLEIERQDDIALAASELAKIELKQSSNGLGFGNQVDTNTIETCKVDRKKKDRTCGNKRKRTQKPTSRTPSVILSAEDLEKAADMSVETSKKPRVKKNPEGPKKYQTAYQYFMKQFSPQKSSNGGQSFLKQASERWKQMKPAEKKVRFIFKA